MATTTKLSNALRVCVICLVLLIAGNAPAADSDGDLFDDDYEISQGTDPNDSGDYPGLPVTGCVQHVVEADGTSRTYLEVTIGNGFVGALPGPIAFQITRTDSGGTTTLSLPAYQYLSQWRDFFWDISGEPDLGVYTFNVTYGIYSGSDDDYHYTTRYLPSPAEDSFSPADGATLTSSTQAFSWGAVEYTPPPGEPSPPIYYRLEINDASKSVRVYASGYLYNRTSFTLPQGVLTPGETYNWRLRVMDGPDWPNYMNRRNSEWRAFTMASSLNHAAVPAIDPDGWGVVSYTRPNPTSTATEIWVRIYDHDGVAADGSSHSVTVRLPGDPTEKTMSFIRSEGNYSAGYEYWDGSSAPAPGEYIFKVIDPNGKVGTFTETVTAADLAALALPDESTIMPNVRDESIRVKYDNIYVNNQPEVYEDFNSYNSINDLDYSKWRWPANAAIEISGADGWLILDIGNSVGRTTGLLAFQNPEAITAIQADISVQNSSGADTRAELRGVWCNNGIGDVTGKLAIDGNRIYYEVTQEYINQHGAYQWDTLAEADVAGYTTGATVTLKVEWIESTSTLQFTVNGTPYDYVVAGALGPPVFESTKELRTRVNLVFDDTTPTISWNQVAGANRYRIRIFNHDNQNPIEVWRDTFGATGPGQVSITVPPGILRPNSYYRYRVEAWDSHSPLNVNSISRTPRSNNDNYQFYTGSQEDESPYMVPRNHGAYVWNNEILEPFLSFLVEVHDAQGVPGDLRVWVEHPDATAEDLVFRPDFPFFEPTPTSGIYYLSPSKKPPVNGGTYTFHVDDGVNHYQFSDVLVVNPVGYPTEASMRPRSGAVIGRTAVTFSWQAVEAVTLGQGYYRLDIFDHDFKNLYTFHTTQNSFNLAAGYLKAGTFYRWRVGTRREYYTEDVDNGSSCPARFYDMPYFVTTPMPDSDGDTLPDEWELIYWSTLNQNDGMGDADNDGLSNSQEYFRGTDPTVADTDGDGQPDGSDPFPLSAGETDDSDGDGQPDNTDPCPFDQTNDSADGDGICSDVDNCPTVANPDQADLNGDGWGDVCDDLDQDGQADDVDAWPIDPENDLDGDGYGADPYGNCADICLSCSELAAICSLLDNCPGEYNPNQSVNPCEPEGGAAPPACHPIKNPCDPPIDDSPAVSDADNDGVPDTEDNCVNTSNPYGVDTNGDGQYDAQLNTDNDAFGDACDPDDDNDGVLDGPDNCPVVSNSDQANQDGDSFGDVCDEDIDGDGLLNSQEVALGTSTTNPDTDGDGQNDSEDPDPLTPSNQQVYRIILRAEVSNVDVTDTWMPSLSWDAANQQWLPAQVTVTAQFKAPNGALLSFPAGTTVSFTLIPSTWEGVATNDTEQYNAQPSNDFSFDAANKEDLTHQVAVTAGVAEISFPLFAFDFGGQARIEASVPDGQGGTALGQLTLPLDSDSDLLPDEWERIHSGAGFDEFNPYSFSPVKHDGDADIDASLNNSFIGDGLSNFREYRGIVFDRLNGSNQIIYSHQRLDPMRKDLFARGDNFANSVSKNYTPQAGTVLPFSVDYQAVYQSVHPSAFGEAGIDVHDVTGMPSFNQQEEPPHIDILVVTNKTEPRPDGLIQTLPTESSLGIEDGYINHPSTLMPRYWTWDLKGASYIGSAQFYAISEGGTIATHTYHLCMMHYFFNRPYMKDVTGEWTGSICYSNAYANKLHPLARVEDYYRENGVGPDSKGKINEDRCLTNTVIDGDRMDPIWKNSIWPGGSRKFEAGKNYSVFDADGDGWVEHPIMDDPALLISGSFDTEYEYNIEQVQIHTVLHEMGHAVGMDAQHTTDPTCLMYQESTNWDRAGHFCPYARSQILIHNKTELQ